MNKVSIETVKSVKVNKQMQRMLKFTDRLFSPTKIKNFNLLSQVPHGSRKHHGRIRCFRKFRVLNTKDNLCKQLHKQNNIQIDEENDEINHNSMSFDMAAQYTDTPTEPPTQLRMQTLGTPTLAPDISSLQHTQQKNQN